MKIYEMHFFITRRSIKEIEALFHFVPWVLGKDFFIWKRKPPSRYKTILTVGNVSVVVIGRNCETDYHRLQ